MHGDSPLLRIDSFLCLADHAVESLIESLENSHEDTTIVGDEFDPVAYNRLQGMLFSLLLSTLHQILLLTSQHTHSLTPIKLHKKWNDGPFDRFPFF